MRVIKDTSFFPPFIFFTAVLFSTRHRTPSIISLEIITFEFISSTQVTSCFLLGLFSRIILVHTYSPPQEHRGCHLARGQRGLLGVWVPTFSTIQYFFTPVKNFCILVILFQCLVVRFKIILGFLTPGFFIYL